MVEWWLINFDIPANRTGYQKVENGECLGVYYSDGTQIASDEKVQYTCVNINASPPSWA